MGEGGIVLGERLGGIDMGHQAERRGLGSAHPPPGQSHLNSFGETDVSREEERCSGAGTGGFPRRHS